MGEEEKKVEEKKPEEKKEEADAKKVVEEKKSEAPPLPLLDEAKGKDEKNDEKEAKSQQPSLPPQEIILRVFMHCEGCARKVRKCLKGFEGVEEVETDCKTHKVVVKGEKADPLKVLERVKKKSHRQVELLSPIPKPPPLLEESKRVEEKKVTKSEEKKDEQPQVINVVLKVHMHCEACAQEIRRRIQRMKGVESAEPDLNSSQVIVKGTFDPSVLIDFIYKKTGKKAIVIKVEPKKKEEEKGNEETKQEEKNEGDQGGKKDEKMKKNGEAEDDKENIGGGNDDGEQLADGEEDPKLEMKKNESYYYNCPQNFQMYNYHKFIQQELHAYPPQLFNDENPNACSIM